MGLPKRLPIQPTPLVDREEELARLVSLLAPSPAAAGAPAAELAGQDSLPAARLVTLTGPGGVGKTRLALAAGAMLAETGPVVFVDLAEAAGPDALPGEILAGLGAPATGAPGPERLPGALAGKSCFLLLDGFEPVVAAAPALGELLAAGPGLRALVTCRRPLGLPEETVFPVGPLAFPPPLGEPAAPGGLTAAAAARFPAVALFAGRAAVARPDFALTDANAAAVAAISTLLEGLPLALELAARRVATFAPSVLLERLRGDLGHSPLGLLAVDEPALPARHASLRGSTAAALRWLTTAECDLFARLSVFAGAFTIEDAAAATGRPPALVRAGLEALVAWHLARAEGARFRLPAAARAVAGAALAESSEEAAARRAHADVYLGRLRAERDALTGEAWAAALARLDPDQEELFAAFAWALETEAPVPSQERAALDELAMDILALGSGYQQAQRFEEYQSIGMLMMGVAMQSQALGPPNPQLEWQAKGNEREAAGDWDGAEDAYRRALAAAESPQAEFRPREYLISLHAKHGRFAEALAEAELATATARRGELEILVGMALSTEATCRLRLGDSAGALAACDEALSLDIGSGGVLPASALAMRARAHLRQGDPGAAAADLDAAWKLLEPMAEMAMAAGVQNTLARWWSATAELRTAAGDLAGAVAARREAVERQRMTGASSSRLADALQDLGDALAAAGDRPGAEEARKASRAMRRELHLPEL